MTQNTDNNLCSSIVTYTVTASDNCDVAVTPSCEPPSGSAFQKGAVAVMCTATDSAGNTSRKQFAVTINDRQKPSVACGSVAGQSANADASCSATVPDVRDLVRAQSSDNCTDRYSLFVLQSPAPGGTVSGLGPHPITVTVLDESNNRTTCTVPFNLSDVTPPSISCPSNLVKSTDADVCTAKVSYTAPAVGDNCSGVGAPVCNPPSGSIFPKGTSTVNCTVKDGSNNMSSCPFTVTVNDTQPPSIICPANVISTAAASCPIAVTNAVTYANPAASDNCGVQSVACIPPSGATFPVGTTTVNCMATDTSGNTSSCSFTVTVFSFCLQDETDGNSFVFVNHITGEYIAFCKGAQVASGKGILNIRGCTGSIEHNKGDRRILIRWDTAAQGANGAGTAIVQVGPNNTKCQIEDKSMINNTCTAPVPAAVEVGKPNKHQTPN